MATKKSSTSPKGRKTKLQFSVDLGPGDLSDKEIEGVGNAITKAILGSARKKSVSSKKGRGPFVKIIYCQLVHAKSVRQ